MPATDAPTVELGYAAGVGGQASGAGGANAGGYGIEPLELTPELTFPASATVFDLMRKTDGQIGGILRSFFLPILAARWRLTGQGIPQHRLDSCAAELGLDLAENDARARRRRQGIVWTEHLREALLAYVFGFMPFEQVYEVGPAGPGQLDDPDLPRLMAHIRKLGARYPRTLTDVRVDRAGGLDSIIQTPPPGQPTAGTLGGIPIPVDRLVYYCPDREGADWTGNSLLRTAYKHWLIKDALLRLGPMVVERNGMGVPVVTYPAGGDEAKALRLAKAFRAGSDAGGALEEGYALALVGVTGATKDELPLVKYHDEAVGKSLLAMVLDLGHDAGARSLGDTFVDLLHLALNAIPTYIGEVATEHIVRDWWELNYGADEPYPVLKCDDISADAIPNLAELANLADKGLLTADDVLEDDLRRRLRLPKRDAGSARTPAVPAMPAPAPGGTYQPAGSNPAEGPPSLIPVTDPTTDPATPPPPNGGTVTVPAHTRRLPTAASDGDLLDRAAAVVERIAALRAG